MKAAAVVELYFAQGQRIDCVLSDYSMIQQVIAVLNLCEVSIHVHNVSNIVQLHSGD